jgi:hypothetical protein
MKKIKVAREYMQFIDCTILYACEDTVEEFVIPSEGDPIVMETTDENRFRHWINALENAGCKYEILS